MANVRSWLESLGLGRYAEAFEANDVELDVLGDLTEQHLAQLGVSLGHRLKLLKAAKLLEETRAAGLGHEVPAQGERTPAGAPTAERRQLTVMFCDLVGSTALSEQLDPEDLRDLMAAYQKAAGAVIEHNHGHVAQYLGDGMVVYFGWPRALEDDAQRAVRAGLEIVEAVRGLAAPRQLSVRVGISTGPVVVGGTGAGDASVPKAAVGETPNVAARVQSLAAPDTVLISEMTRRLLGGAFELDDLGPHELKGVDGAIGIHRVLAPSTAESRFEATRAAALTPLVGREVELATLLERWERATAGRGQVVLLWGEAGIGKSRITETLRERAARQPHVRLSYQCSPHHTNSALHPVLEQIERATDLSREDDVDTKLAKLEAELGDATMATLIGAMLSLDITRRPPLGMTPKRQREATLAALVDRVVRLSRAQPVLMLFEDVHWIDPTTQELLERLVQAVAAHPVVVVITFRPEYTPPWTDLEHLVRVPLTRLGPSQATAMVSRVTGGKPFPADVVHQIVTKTDGVPLFVEELTKTVLESGLLEERDGAFTLTGPLTELAIPSSLRDSLMARLDRLSPIKEIAQLGACIGRAFSYELLAAVSPLQGAELRDALAQLVDSQLVHRTEGPAGTTYAFKHALVQDTAYESLLKSRRRHFHTIIASALEERFPATLDTEPELVAFHYTAAGLSERAAPYWLAAGELALSRMALSDAVSHLTRALQLNGAAAPSTARDRQELKIRNALGTAYMPLLGWTAPNYERAVTPAVALGKALDEPALLLPPLWGLWLVSACRAEFDAALGWAQDMIDVGGSEGGADLLIMGHAAATVTRMWMGDFSAARRHCERVLERHDLARHRHLVQVTNHDPKCIALAWASHFLWILGHPDQAVAAGEEQLRVARELAHPFNLGFALIEGSGAHCHRREPERQRVLRDEGLAIALEQELAALSSVSAHGYFCESLLTMGRPEEAHASAQAGLAAWHAIAGETISPYMKAVAAAACGELGRVPDGLASIDDAIDNAGRTGERWFLAEAHRIKGTLLLRAEAADPATAERCFLEALEIARAQRARGWELRAATSLARLWQAQGKSHQARELLAPIHGWFTEGLDTADLLDAQALLEALG